MVVTVRLHSYAPRAWTNVQRDEKQLQRSRFRGWLKQGAPDYPADVSPER
jgi:hypothetical protein